MNFHGPLSRHSGKINNWLVLGMQLAAPTALQSPCSGGMHRGQGDCKKPCSVSYAPISNVNLNHRHTQCLSPLTKNTWIIPLVSYSLWERSEASVPTTLVLWNYTLEKKKKGRKLSSVKLQSLAVYTAKMTWCCTTEIRKLLTGDLTQEVRSQPVHGLWSHSNMLMTVTERNLNPHSTAKLNISLAV